MRKNYNKVFWIPYLFSVVFWFVALFIFCNTARAAGIDQMTYDSLIEVKKSGVPLNSFWLMAAGFFLFRMF